MCDTMVVVQEDRVLFAKNSDRDPNEAQALEWHARREHPPGARVRCTWIEIPQAAVTHAVLLARPFWLWGAEMGVNEHGVVIGNEAVFTREPYAATGLTGMDLLRLALERARTAREALDVLRALLDEHGQGGGCGHEDRSFTYHNSFLIADAAGAFVLETAGRLHAVEEVRAGARSISNGLTIPGFDRHADPLVTKVACAKVRRARSQALAGEATGAGDLFRVLRDHGEGRAWPRYGLVGGAIDCVCAHAGGVVTSTQTTGSLVAELTPGRASIWATGTAAPCVSIFKPMRVDTPLDLGRPTDHDDGASLWWRHERLHRAFLRAPARVATAYLRERDALEAAWLRDPPPPREALAAADGLLLARFADRLAAHPPADERPPWTRRYWARREALARGR